MEADDPSITTPLEGFVQSEFASAVSVRVTLAIYAPTFDTPIYIFEPL